MNNSCGNNYTVFRKRPSFLNPGLFLELFPGFCRDNAPRQYVDFRQLLGEEAWYRLVPEIRQRFSINHEYSKVVKYKGVMRTVRCNAPGRVFAQLCRLIGTPISPYTGVNVPTIVRVYDEGRLKGTVWEREYRFPDRRPLVIRSTKCLDTDKRLLESIDGGIRMKLHVFEKNGNLEFISRGYFVKLFGIRIPIPSMLSPGRTRVVHTDLGNNCFRFILSITHPWFGELFYQDGVFSEEEQQ